ncbi:ACP S-malonyltransferase [Synechococcus sp. PCC 7336]|uniref:ACP S-malonyltransferase n=1 Tax=Synechococcus sp. PCC 7336 TaxID=195250 RepID=UPI00034C9F55|nr:ACP S-malonyltransferase [Synechococcus sp. PCC 7336]
MSIAWIFPGQGSQAVGMGVDLADLPHVKTTLEKAEFVLGWSLLDLTAEQLKETTYTQPALYIIETLLADRLKSTHSPAAVAGHSLGEYSALYCAGVFDFLTGLKLVQQRSQLMATARAGTMAAVMGFDRDRLEALCEQTEGVVVANDNSSDQVVLSGEKLAIESVIAAAKPKRSIFLPVSGAFHSPLMADAAAQFASVLETVEFQPPAIPVYSNVTAAATRDPEIVKANLRNQVTGSVRWRETISNMVADGVDTVWEVGPGKVLTGLTRRIDRNLGRVNIGDATSLAAMLNPSE